MFFRTLAVASLCVVSQFAVADNTDHPLLSRYPGADVSGTLKAEYEQYRMPSGPVTDEGIVRADPLVGDLTMLTYDIRGVSTLKVFENYRDALERLGAVPVFVCELDQCGTKGNGIKDLGAVFSARGSVYNGYRKPYVVRSQLDSAKGTIHIGLFIGGYDGNVTVQQVIVEEVPLEDELIEISPGYLSEDAQDSAAGHERTDEERQEDHPLIARYPGAKLRDFRAVEYEQFDIPVGPMGQDDAPGEQRSITGDMAQHTYMIDNVSTLKVVENYRNAVETLGFSIVYECSLDTCGGKRSASALGASVAVSNSVYNYYRKPYYFVARNDSPQGPVTIAFYVGGYDGDASVQQVIVEEKGTQSDLVQVDADQLYQEIQKTGKALIYGIYFDIDSATLKPESADALQAISDLLGARPELSLYVVGHTDDTGEGDYNLSLSSRRASSVVDALKTEYSIDDDRLKPAGVGPYAPVAGNESDEGRRLNRRVELVRRL